MGNDYGTQIEFEEDMRILNRCGTTRTRLYRAAPDLLEGCEQALAAVIPLVFPEKHALAAKLRDAIASAKPARNTSATNPPHPAPISPPHPNSDLP